MSFEKNRCLEEVETMRVVFDDRSNEKTLFQFAKVADKLSAVMSAPTLADSNDGLGLLVGEKCS
jgi:hypothetical protein